MLQIRSPAAQIKTIDYAHSAATTHKTPVLINAHLFIPLDDAAANAQNAFVYAAEISGGDKAAVALAFGDKVYWDDTAKKFTNVATSNTLVGYALEAAASGDATTGIIAFNSFAA
ncbi:MAG: DUF2190 family protein [Mizugakiibacter sp.]|uniref:DUF2190 family protein n=1 Tax=Mizugakiibacter sp. TaxID=1972610 RepID=UPI00320E66E0